MKIKKDNFDYFILRHIIFLYGELKSIFIKKLLFKKGINIYFVFILGICQII